MTTAKACSNNSPSWFTGHWRDWHRGHGCAQDDGKNRSEAAIAEIAQHETNKATGYLTDAEMNFLRARTTSGDTLLVRALDELRERRALEKKQADVSFVAPFFDHSARTTKHFDPLLGYCVCGYCAGLPAIASQIRETP